MYSLLEPKYRQNVVSPVPDAILTVYKDLSLQVSLPTVIPTLADRIQLIILVSTY